MIQPAHATPRPETTTYPMRTQITHLRIPAHLICPGTVDWHSPLEEIKRAHAVSAQLEVHLSLKLVWSVSASSVPITCTHATHPCARPPISQSTPATLLRLLSLQKMKLVAAVSLFFPLESGVGHWDRWELWKWKENTFKILSQTRCRFVVFFNNLSSVPFNCSAERRSLGCLWLQRPQI